MSDLAGIQSSAIFAGGEPPRAATRLEPPRSWFNAVMVRTFTRTSARIGLFWILVIAFGAIFAPLLANSFPLLVEIDGKWSSPALRYFTSTDATLILSALVGVPLLLCIRQISLPRRILILLASITVVLILSLLVVHPPLVAGYEDYRVMQSQGKLERVIWAPVAFSPNDHLREQSDEDTPFPWAPSRTHLLGTEGYGEDVLSVMIHACRIAMAIGFIATGLATLLAILVGGLMGYFAGAVDLIGMRLVEIFSAIPSIYLIMTFCAVFERNIYLVMVIIGLTSWPGDARFVRAEFLKLRGQDFVHAAIASGLPLRSVLFRHILPNALAPLLVSASFGVASAILTETTLSFLGIGLPVDAASWGRLLNQAVASSGGFYWWIAIYPGIAIFLTVFSYNLIGEALRDALDPRLAP